MSVINHLMKSETRLQPVPVSSVGFLRPIDCVTEIRSANRTTVLDASQFGKKVNPLSGNPIIWTTSPPKSFSAENFPSNMDFDLAVKQHIFENSKNLPRNYGIIDCGAHIGDATIPLAEALKAVGRADITIYAIDPSPDKCLFISHVARLNGLEKNIKVLNCGLSDTDGETFTWAVDENWMEDKNTGGTRWHDVKYTEKCAQDREQIVFFTLDSLVAEKKIQHPIGYIHLDVEDMEPQAIRGGFNLIKSTSPILSCEAPVSSHEESILQVLQELSQLTNQEYRKTGMRDNNAILEPSKI